MNLGLVVMKLQAFLGRMGSEESGQDLAEYCLLTALLTLVAAAIFVQASGGLQAVWNGATVSLSAGRTAAATAGGVSEKGAAASTAPSATTSATGTPDH